MPDEILAQLNDTGQKLLDTDWHVPTLYDGLMDDVTIVRANFSRYVIDANRDPKGKSLYPGHNTTELVPTNTFDNEPIWHSNPTPTQIAYRLTAFHRPYHAALKAEIERIRAYNGFAVLYDCHSIRSEIPHLFDNKLPDFSIGDNNGTSCHASLTDAVQKACAKADQYNYVVNGRFRGGWTTRNYGQPVKGIHAIQMELAQRQYLENEVPPFNYDKNKADNLKVVLKDVLEAIQLAIQSNKFIEILDG